MPEDLFRNSDFLSRTATNLVDANITSVRQHKSAFLESKRRRIEAIHKRIMAENDIQNKDICRMQRLLPQRLREVFIEQKKAEGGDHSQHFRDLNELNDVFISVLDSLCSYRVDLGNSVQKLVECYCSVFLQQFQTFYTVKKPKLSPEEVEAQKLKEKQAELDKIKADTLEQQEFCRQYIASKDSELAKMKELQASLETQINQLREMARKDKAEEEETREVIDGQKKEFDEKPHNAKDYDRNKRIALKQNPNDYSLLHDPGTLPEFKDSIQTQAQLVAIRNEYAESLFNEVKKMLKNKMKSQHAQTEQACMNNAIMYEYQGGDTSSEEARDEAENSQEQGDTME